MIENWMGMFVFFYFSKAIPEFELFKEYFNNTDDEMFKKSELVEEICDLNPTIRRSVYLNKKEQDLSDNVTLNVGNEFAKNILAAMLTGTIITPIELVWKGLQGTFSDLEVKQSLKFISLNIKVNYVKFLLQYGICLSLLRTSTYMYIAQ
jgi:hypothetical protein